MKVCIGPTESHTEYCHLLFFQPSLNTNDIKTESVSNQTIEKDYTVSPIS